MPIHSGSVIPAIGADSTFCFRRSRTTALMNTPNSISRAEHRSSPSSRKLRDALEQLVAVVDDAGQCR